MTDWRPSALHGALSQRARLLAGIRAFFAERDVLEIEVPVLGLAGVTDVHIDNPVVAGEPPGYLQSSPEYFLKRLLVAFPEPVYYLGKAFRAGERGRLHHPEFTLLEWYRPGWDDRVLMDEVETLLRDLGAAGAASCPRLDYGACFRDALGIDPHRVDDSCLRTLAAEVAGQSVASWCDEPRAICLDLLFSLKVEPRLPAGVVFVTHYPVCQAALARVVDTPDGVPVARRFEVFLNRVELANGYWELTDAAEQRRRFAVDAKLRRVLGRPVRPADERLLAALDAGLPDCAGVALGVDRLLMQLVGAAHIREVLAFAEG
ncbi:MAG: EF-P lysine aminoacylase EpmA [Porticoccaceae bacterium]